MYKVYRYESPYDQTGVFNCSLSKFPDKYKVSKLCDKIHGDHIGNKDHPTLQTDGLDFALEMTGFLCACNSIKELLNWFDKYNKKLIKSGFVIAEYIVIAKFDGKSGLQCVFNEKAIIERNVISTF
jgi:hypothetical protein